MAGAPRPPAEDSTIRVALHDAALELSVARESVRGALFPRLKALRTLGRYELRRRIGDGGMGLILAAYDPMLDREIAIKILRPQVEDKPGAPGLLAEARAVARLSHPNVVAVHDVDLHEGRIFVAMELVRGPSLRAWLGSPRTWPQIIEVFLQAGRGLAAAHDAGLVHRDFKPGNVLVGDDGRVRVVDFGLARPDASIDTAAPRTLDGPISRTISGVIAGTPAYMAPEQWIGGTIDARADQFAYCVCLFEALHGRRPFDGDTIAAIRDAVLGAPLRLPSATDPPSAVIRMVLERGLSRHRDDRYPDMHALLLDLQGGSVPNTRITADLGSPAIAADSAAVAADIDRKATAAAYIAALPQGLASFPECRIDAAIVRLALTQAPVDDPIIAEVRGQYGLDRERWVPETCGRAVFAAIADARDLSGEDYEHWIRRLVRARLASGFARFGLPPSTSARAADALPRAWQSLHRGTALVVAEAAPGTASIVLQHPAGLLDERGRVDVVQTVRATMEHVGARVVDVRLADVQSDRIHARVRWG